MQKKIYIDLTISGNNNGFVSGAGEYGLVIFNELKKIINKDFLYVGVKSTSNIDNSVLDNILNTNILRYNDLSALNKLLIENNIATVFFPQLLREYVNIKTDSKVVAVLHDIGDILDIENNKKDYYGKYYELTNFQKIKFFIKSHSSFIMDKIIQRKINEYKDVINNFKDIQLVTVSHFSKSTIKYYLSQIKVNPIVLYSPLKLYNYCNDDSFTDAFKAKYNISEYKYFLFCNGKRVRKNNSISLLAFDDFLSKTNRKDFIAVILGSDVKYEKYIIPKLKNKENFKFYGYVDKNDFEQLYKFAHLFVFPSILEGFGSPPIEALKYETLCACSTATSIPEICQDSVIYFDPYNIKSIEYAYYQSFDENYVYQIKGKIQSRFSSISERQKGDLNKLVNMIIS